MVGYVPQQTPSPDLLTRVTHSGSFLVIMALCKEQQHEDFGGSVGGLGCNMVGWLDFDQMVVVVSCCIIHLSVLVPFDLCYLIFTYYVSL